MDMETRPKRYFLRRLAAFAVDFILAYALAVIILMAVDTVTGGHFYAWSGLVTRTACADAPPSPLLDEINSSHPVAPGWTRTQAVCQHFPIGGKAQDVLTVKDEMRDGALTRTSWLAFAVSATGDRLDPSLRLDPTAFVAYALMLAWTWRFGRSPGKRWLGLVVQSFAADAESQAQLVRREWFRLGPLALGSLVEVVFGLLSWWVLDSLPDYIRMAGLITANFIALTAAYAVVLLAFAVYYAFPFLRWRGQSFYDRLAGTIVRRG